MDWKMLARTPQKIRIIAPGFIEGLELLAAMEKADLYRALSSWLSKATLEKCAYIDYYSIVFQNFNFHPASGKLPFAAVEQAATLENSSKHRLLCAPVHLHVDLNHMRLFDSHFLGVSKDEYTQIQTLLEAYFSDKDVGLYPCRSRKDTWLLALDAPLDINTYHPEYVMGQHVDTYLPFGPDAAVWNARSNDIQMLLSQHPLNRARIASGMPTINSVWFYGAGFLPKEIQTFWQCIYGGSVLEKTLASLAKINYQPDIDCLLIASQKKSGNCKFCISA